MRFELQVIHFHPARVIQITLIGGIKKTQQTYGNFQGIDLTFPNDHPEASTADDYFVPQLEALSERLGLQE